MSEGAHVGLGLLPLLLVAAAGLVGRLWPDRLLPATDRLLGGRAAPLLAGAVTSYVIYQVWGSLDAVPVIHDEAAYLLQAQMLAGGHLVGPPPPLPQFFEQFHVFVTPVLAARYPVGFALALVPGVWAGLPGLMPVILSGLTGAVLFLLARRVSTPQVALLAWLLWVVTPGNLRFRPSYLTESLTGLLWLASWWSVLEWRRTGRRGWLLGLSLMVAWQTITRPVTAIAFTAPVAVVVLLTTYRTRRWADLATAVALGAACLAVLPFQNKVSTGSWRRTPLTLYSKVYFPFDLPGFGLDSTPPQRELPADFQAFAARFAPLHRDFVPARLPVIFAHRTGLMLLDAWGRWWPAFAVLALAGLLSGGREAQFGTATVLVLLLCYLTFAHDDRWMVYYLEGETVLLFLVAAGAWRFLQKIVGRPPGIGEPRAGLALLLLCLCAAASWPEAIRDARATERYVSFDQEQFRRRVAGLPGPAVVFIRYGPDHDFNHSLIMNQANLERAHAWLVYDRGAENFSLIALAPGRTPWLYEEERRRFVRLGPDGTPP
jgi:hypothetical protein